MKSLTWLDRLLIKVALAKSVARDSGFVSSRADELLDAFRAVNAASSDTSRSGADEGRQ